MRRSCRQRSSSFSLKVPIIVITTPGFKGCPSGRLSTRILRPGEAAGDSSQHLKPEASAADRKAKRRTEPREASPIARQNKKNPPTRDGSAKKEGQSHFRLPICNGFDVERELNLIAQRIGLPVYFEPKLKSLRFSFPVAEKPVSQLAAHGSFCGGVGPSTSSVTLLVTPAKRQIAHDLSDLPARACHCGRLERQSLETFSTLKKSGDFKCPSRFSLLVVTVVALIVASTLDLVGSLSSQITPRRLRH